jgi:hypothetical protein
VGGEAMKKKVPAKTVDVCDVCHRESGFIETCIVCGGEYCISCRAIMCGCVHEVDACLDCGKLPIVQDVVERYVPRLMKVLNLREEALKRLGKSKKFREQQNNG